MQKLRWERQAEPRRRGCLYPQVVGYPRKPGQVDLCFLLTSASSSPQPSPLGKGASQATFGQRLAYPLDMAFSPHRWV